MIAEVATTYKDERNNVDTSFHLIYTQGGILAEKVGTAVGMPRITSRQQHRSNIGASSAKEYFQINIAIPLLDHIIMCIDQQFSPSAGIAISLLGLVPSILCSKDVSLEPAVSMYETDLPSPELLQMEITMEE